MLPISTKGSFSIERPAIIGLIIAPIWFVADQGTKWWVIQHLTEYPERVVPVTSFFNLVLGWNRGVSFGMLSGLALPAWSLAILALTVSAVLLIWLWRTSSWLVSCGLGLLVGGALSNALDRLRYGAVTDFLDFHLAGWHWPAFNLADAGIVCGALALILDVLIADRASGSAPHEPMRPR